MIMTMERELHHGSLAKELPAKASLGNKQWRSSNRKRIIVMAGNRSIV
jgi:hypothetical protein